ncbi:MAG: GntR family transcriptional regulator [Hyphomicrobiales bacterium]|nr:GntR family transcriptional regulator [Hyphomicrobiales bacterium]
MRLRFGDGTPLSREVAWYDLTIAPELADWNVEGSAYHYIQRVCDIRLKDAEQTVEAVLASAVECRAFGFATPLPCLLFKRRTRALSGQIVEYVEGTFRGDAYIYRLKLT